MGVMLPLSEAKARLSTCVRAVEGGEVVVITRHGRPVAGLISIQELRRLERLKRCSSLPGRSQPSLQDWRASLPEGLDVDPTGEVEDVFRAHRGRGLAGDR